jgi:hypothetical protein
MSGQFSTVQIAQLTEAFAIANKPLEERLSDQADSNFSIITQKIDANFVILKQHSDSNTLATNQKIEDLTRNIVNGISTINGNISESRCFNSFIKDDIDNVQERFNELERKFNDGAPRTKSVNRF